MLSDSRGRPGFKSQSSPTLETCNFEALEATEMYSSVPNKSAGRNKSAGWNIYQKLIKVQAEIIMQVGIFFKT